MGDAPSTITSQDLFRFIDGTDVETLPTKAMPLLRRFARGAAREMPPDLQEEVVSQSLEYLIRYGAQFRPERGTAASFLKVMVGEAARRVRADYCPPGQRTRLERRDRRRAGRKALSLSKLDLDTFEFDPDSAHGTRNAARDLETRCDVRAIVECATARIARALVLIYFVGEAVSAAAKAVGMSRFALRREITRFTNSVCEAQARLGA
jgi:DNA-directed RNA polymerase specialized sigma24 family protein